ncbi:uncharacterized protein LOC127601550 [Hippocampus zosterae]|uniref:uncharacterized protein LOC127601550 n=1 Tax=Hippocampus zosterae TaxID=109293 RepID=UPI00223D0E35|nr:uncharacterized protein LOC127601550 [Hippocampus zosterae]
MVMMSACCCEASSSSSVFLFWMPLMFICSMVSVCLLFLLVGVVLCGLFGGCGVGVFVVCVCVLHVHVFVYWRVVMPEQCLCIQCGCVELHLSEVCLRVMILLQLLQVQVWGGGLVFVVSLLELSVRVAFEGSVGEASVLFWSVCALLPVGVLRGVVVRGGVLGCSLHFHVMLYCLVFMFVQCLCTQCGVWWLHLKDVCLLVICCVQMSHVQVVCCVCVCCVRESVCVGPGFVSMSPAWGKRSARHPARFRGRLAEKKKKTAVRAPRSGCRDWFLDLSPRSGGTLQLRVSQGVWRYSRLTAV